MSYRPSAPHLVGGLVLVVLAATGAWLVQFEPISVITFLCYALVGTYLVIRRPRNGVGWLLVAIGWLNIATTTDLSDADIAAIQARTASLGTEFAFWIGPAVGSLTFVAYAALAFVFPSGSLPSGRRGRVIAVLVLVGVIIPLAPAFFGPTTPYQIDGVTEIQVRNPFVIAPVLDGEAAAGIGMLVVTMVPLLILAAAVVDTIRRYRRGDETLRAQLRWLMAASAFVVSAVLVGLASYVTMAEQIGGLGWVPALVAYPLVPLAVGAAVLRYRLFEIDRIVSRTIGWFLVTTVLVAMFAALVIGLQAALDGLTQGQTLAVAASTLAALAVFQPLRRRIQRAVDRRFDRDRYDAERTAIAFAERLRAEVDLDTVAVDLVRTVVGTVRPTSADLWLPRRTSG